MAGNKSAAYARLRRQIEKLFEKQEDAIARMATVNALLYHKMPGFLWVGFYLLRDDRLLVGPYQGPLACMELEKGRGVCWSCIKQQKTLVVSDVHEFPGHIACDPRSRSEIAVPVRNTKGEVVAVLDVDSRETAHFDAVDAGNLEAIASVVFTGLPSVKAL